MFRLVQAGEAAAVAKITAAKTSLTEYIMLHAASCAAGSTADVSMMPHQAAWTV
jgi:hypothetical protein